VLSATVTSVETAGWFRRPWSPFALLDRDLCVRAVSPAFESVTGHARETVVGRSAFDAFPDNPGDPTADGVARVGSSLEKVLQTQRSDWMPLQRYDIPDVTAPGAFVVRAWLPVNIPVLEGGRVVGVLHHSQDVSALLRTAPLGGVGHDASELSAAAERLYVEYPNVAPETVLSLLTDSERLVIDVLGAPDHARALELARLRLDVQAGLRRGVRD
jgi:hypothetical protein